jgi:hypothetical protein
VRGGGNRHDAAAWGAREKIWRDEGGQEGSIGVGIPGLRGKRPRQRSRAAEGGWRGRIAILNFTESVGLLESVTDLTNTHTFRRISLYSDVHELEEGIRDISSLFFSINIRSHSYLFQTNSILNIKEDGQNHLPPRGRHHGGGGHRAVVGSQ